MSSTNRGNSFDLTTGCSCGELRERTVGLDGDSGHNVDVIHNLLNSQCRRSNRALGSEGNSGNGSNSAEQHGDGSKR